MRDLYKEYKQGLISWDRAYATANNLANNASNQVDMYEETDYWATQMESLAVDAAESLMKMLGYQMNEGGAYILPDNN